jgi:dihydroflavonol-4-reductase
MWDVNVNGTEHVIAAAREAGAQRLIHCSSVDAIGLPEDGTPSDETVAWNWDRLGLENPYARTKYESQKRALAANGQGLEVVVVNPAYLLGAFDVRPTSGQMILEVQAGKTVGYTRGGNNFVHVEDVADAMVAAGERGRPGELYILGNANMTYREIFTLIADVVGAKPPRFAIPYALARVGGWAGDAVSVFQRGEPAVTTATAKLGFVDHYYDPSKARRELGLRQTPVREAIERAVGWFREVGMLPR